MVLQVVGTVILGFIISYVYHKIMLYSMSAYSYISSMGYISLLLLRYSLIVLSLVMFSIVSNLLIWWVGGFICGSLYCIQKVRNKHASILFKL